MALKKINYRQYLSSPEWEDIRQRLFNARGKQCEECGSKRRIEVHHLTYDNIGKERLEDLQILCRKCHHGKHPDKINKYVLVDPKKKERGAELRPGNMWITQNTLESLRTSNGGVIKEVYTLLGGGTKGWFRKSVGKQLSKKDYLKVVDVIQKRDIMMYGIEKPKKRSKKGKGRK